LGEEDNGAPFDPVIRGCDDWDLWLRLAERWEFVYEDRVALRYRIHAGNDSRDRLYMYYIAVALYEKHLARHRDDPERLAVLRAAYEKYRGSIGTGDVRARARRHRLLRGLLEKGGLADLYRKTPEQLRLRMRDAFGLDRRA
jgi:hypothetical protein